MSDARPKTPERDPLFRLDANLVVALDALLRERNVTRAARRLGMGQPGLSHALARLRLHFSDPLLVRQGRQMALTARAERLVEPVREAVEALERVFARERGFDPRTSRRAFRVAITDGVGHVLLPRLLRAVRAKAPHVALQFLPITAQPVAEELAAGRVDVAVTYFGALPPSMRREALFEERYVGLVARTSPLRSPLGPGRYAAATHVSVETRPGAYSRLGALLDERGIARRVAVTVPHFLLAPLAVEDSPHVATLGSLLARSFAAQYAVRVVELGLDLPGYEISQAWHERADADAALAWLRSTIASVLKAPASQQKRARLRKHVVRA